jgi:MoxR-like ATPase
MSSGPNFVEHYLKCINLVIHGKEREAQLLLATWLSGGHVLIEDVPGTGKTVLSKTFARLFGLDFGRVQFTPDLLPADILGTTLFNREKNSFQFHQGPIFSNIFLADEINRATPRTQSALLEAMAERQVTVDGKTHPLPENFFVLATQNPIEHHGTFPLPEAQLDRFTIRLSIGHPDSKSEIQMIRNHLLGEPLKKIKQAFEKQHLDLFFSDCAKVQVPDAVILYAQDLVARSRDHKDLELGASPRVGIAIVRLARAWAYLQGEEFVTPTHLYELAPYVFSHRLILNSKARMEGKEGQSVVRELLKSVKVPTR